MYIGYMTQMHLWIASCWRLVGGGRLLQRSIPPPSVHCAMCMGGSVINHVHFVCEVQL